jgi:hypothetical protein
VIDELATGGEFELAEVGGPHLHLVQFSPRDDQRPPGWLVTYVSVGGVYFAASARSWGEANEWVRGWAVGGPMTLRADCIAPPFSVLRACVYFAQHRDMTPAYTWVRENGFWGEP